jgi:hypothetical protein
LNYGAADGRSYCCYLSMICHLPTSCSSYFMWRQSNLYFRITRFVE